MSPSDADLLRAADGRAFGELYGRHAAALHGWFAQRVPWAAADLTAETFARAWLSRRRFRDDRDGSALPWLLGIGRNVLRESARQDRVETAARQRLGLPLTLADDELADVDARTYNPIEFRTRGTGGGTVLRFVSYERLPVTDATRRLLSIAAQHGDAPVVRDRAAYEAAVAKAFPNG